MFKIKDTEKSFLQGILLAYLILFLHILLIVSLGLLVIFFRGIINYMGWILLGVLVSVIGLCYFFYMGIKNNGKTFKNILNSSMFNSRSVEVNFLGGLATFKLGGLEENLSIKDDSSKKMFRLEEASNISVDELIDMLRLLEKGLITREEFNMAKNKMFKL